MRLRVFQFLEALERRRVLVENYLPGHHEAGRVVESELRQKEIPPWMNQLLKEVPR